MESESDICGSEQCSLSQYSTLTLVFRLYSKLLVDYLSLGMAGFTFTCLPSCSGNKGAVCYDEKCS